MTEEDSSNRSLSFDLTSCFNKVQESQLSIEKILPKQTYDDIISNALSTNIILPQSGKFDNLIKNSFSDCYGGFVSITDPVLESDIVTILAQKLKEFLPTE